MNKHNNQYRVETGSRSNQTLVYWNECLITVGCVVSVPMMLRWICVFVPDVRRSCLWLWSGTAVTGLLRSTPPRRPASRPAWDARRACSTCLWNWPTLKPRSDACGRSCEYLSLLLLARQLFSFPSVRRQYRTDEPQRKCLNEGKLLSGASLLLYWNPLEKLVRCASVQGCVCALKVLPVSLN